MSDRNDVGHAETADEMRWAQTSEAEFVRQLRERVRRLEVNVELLEQDRTILAREVRMLRARLGVSSVLASDETNASDRR